MHEDLERALKTLKNFQDDVAGIGYFPDRMLVKNYEEFVSILYNDIDKIVTGMERNSELRQEESEDHLTIQVKENLHHMGYNSVHDEKIGGHCDLVIKKYDWLWIGEAKIFDSRGYTWLHDGFQQLTTRYSTGGYKNSQGGMLIYIRKANAKKIMEKWKTHLIDNNKDANDLNAFDFLENSLTFYSEHSHQRTGLAFKVRHIPFCLHFDPKK